jgi:hypothetical protein
MKKSIITIILISLLFSTINYQALAISDISDNNNSENTINENSKLKSYISEEIEEFFLKEEFSSTSLKLILEKLNLQEKIEEFKDIKSWEEFKEKAESILEEAEESISETIGYDIGKILKKIFDFIFWIVKKIVLFFINIFKEVG